VKRVPYVQSAELVTRTLRGEESAVRTECGTSDAELLTQTLRCKESTVRTDCGTCDVDIMR